MRGVGDVLEQSGGSRSFVLLFVGWIDSAWGPLAWLCEQFTSHPSQGAKDGSPEVLWLVESDSVGPSGLLEPDNLTSPDLEHTGG
jgi:hypothetical protein